MLKKRWDFWLTIFTLFLIYAYQIFSRFDYHDNFYRYSYGQINCATQPQTLHLFSLGRFGGVLWNCYYNQNLTFGISLTYVVRLISFFLLAYFLYLVWSEFVIHEIGSFSRIVALFLIANIYGIQEAVFFITTSAVIPALIIATWAYIYIRKHQTAILVPLLLLVTSFTFYQFAPAIFLAMYFMQHLYKDVSINFKYLFVFVGASILYFIITKMVLILFKCNICNPGERKVEISNPLSWIYKLENHSYFATHFFGPFISHWLIIIFVILIFFFAKVHQVLKMRTLVEFVVFYFLIIGSLVISPGENTFFRTYIPQQILSVFLITYIIDKFPNRIKRFFGVLFILISSISITLTNINVISPLKSEVTKLISYDFTKYDCVIAAHIKPQIRYSFFSNILNYKTDEWGSVTSNNWQDVKWLLSAITQYKLDLKPYSNKAADIKVLYNENYKEESQKCKRILDLDAVIFK